MEIPFSISRARALLKLPGLLLALRRATARNEVDWQAIRAITAKIRIRGGRATTRLQIRSGSDNVLRAVPGPDDGVCIVYYCDDQPGHVYATTAERTTERVNEDLGDALFRAANVEAAMSFSAVVEARRQIEVALSEITALSIRIDWVQGTT